MRPHVKYVIIDGKAIIFSDRFQHSDMVGFGQTVEGAGFVFFRSTINEYGEPRVEAITGGMSVSLGVESRGEIDSAIITRQIANPSY